MNSATACGKFSSVCLPQELNLTDINIAPLAILAIVKIYLVGVGRYLIVVPNPNMPVLELGPI